MLLVLGMAGALWGVGWAMGMPHQARWLTIGLLYVGVMIAHTVLPDGNALRANTGGSAAPWLLLGAAAGIVWIYRQGLMRLRRMVPDTLAEPPQPGKFSEAELNRYARHIMLREVGGPGQRALSQARVLVIGAGGLGSPALLYLAAAGVGTIGVIDDDAVDATNLQRQVIHSDARIGMAKVFSAQAAVEALNPFVTLRPYNRRLDDGIAAELFADYDLILDGSDNFDTRYLVNRAAVAAGKPLIAAAMTQWEGQISLYDPARGGPCFECVFPTRPAPGLVPSCAEAGIVAPLPGVIGSMMALEAVKHITDAGEGLRGRMLIHDALYTETRIIALKRRPDCPVCGTNANAQESDA